MNFKPYRLRIGPLCFEKAGACWILTIAGCGFCGVGRQVGVYRGV
ncbi:hypothetical protein ABIC11_001058 [Pseudomonas oryzihabitans]